MNISNDNRQRKGYDILPKILCVIAAFILWLYVTQVESVEYEETFKHVPVELVNTSVIEANSGLYVYSGHGNTVNVTVSGRKSVINRFTAENLVVTADVSTITEPGKHTVTLAAEAPTGLSVSGMSVSSIDVYVDEKSTVEARIDAKITSGDPGEGCEFGKLSPEFPFVTVTGPKTITENIDYALVSLDLKNYGQISETIYPISSLDLISKNGEQIDQRYVELNREEVQVTVTVETTKEVPVLVKHNYSDGYVEISYDVPYVKVKGEHSELEKLDSIILGEIDKSTIAKDVTETFLIPSLNNYNVTLVDDISEISVDITHVNTEVRGYNVSSDNVKLINPNKLSCEIQTDNLYVNIRGSKNVLDSITEKNIKVSVDLSEYTEAFSGVESLKAEISVVGVSGEAYSVGSYILQVKIG